MTNLNEPSADKSDREPRMRAQLEAELAPTLLEISDDSHLHAGHAGAASGGSHYSRQNRVVALRGPQAGHASSSCV